ncbi:MAG TPA: DUF2254 domain-containing protein [Sphingomicrobium sp.]|nr:DUF2254 domain-containing protein [Sphingomicrobium sp.]
MQARIEEIISAIRSSYWFVPSVMTLAAIALAAFMVWLDVTLGHDWLDQHLGWYQSIKPSGARDVLSTIAGATLTVAGTAFSITIAAISFASGKFGPRLLTNFMGDRGNTFTLGTFVATFVYCLFVLRTVREGDEGGFVPQLAVAMGMVLALCSVAMLIYFIHHVPRAIHINNVIAGIGRQLIDGIDKRFPKPIGKPASEEDAGRAPPIPPGPPATVTATTAGYIQAIEEEHLLGVAEQHELLVRLDHRPGDFIASGRPLMSAWPKESVSDAVCDDLRNAFVTGNERTPHHDLNFLIMELVEISGRALSSGVSDPVTAVTCMDWLGAALGELAGREMPVPYRAGKDGKTRVIALPDHFANFVDKSFGALRQYLSRDAIATQHALRTMGLVAAECPAAGQLRSLDAERQRLVDLARTELDPAARDSVEQINAQLCRLLAAGPGRIDKRDAAALGSGGREA